MKAIQDRKTDSALLRYDMLTGISGDVPIISWAISRGLRDDVGDSAYSAFLGRYIRMWPHRYTRLAAALTQGDCYQAMDIALSIRSSGQMLGALRVSRVASALERALRKGNLQAARDLVHVLKSTGNTTVRQMSATSAETT